jgi:uncharacterized protein (TIRG00374 family)
MNKRRLITTLKVTTPFILGGAILYWMFRNFDFKSMERVLCEEMNWWWMLLSFPFGILAQAFRGWRWKQALEPVGENPRTSTTIYSIFISYAASLAVPRIGEFTRCGVLKRWEGTSFPKAIGTVVTERAVDSLLILILTLITFLSQVPVFLTFFSRTGTRFDEIFGMFTTTGYIVTAICGIAVLISLYSVRKKLSFYDKVKATLHGVIEGVMSLRGVKNIPLFLFYSIAIWASYFLHYYLTFFCFSGTAHLGITCAMVTFIVGSIAVLVPTPNGAGPWHFAVKTMLILYGVADNEALYFVLIVHTVQTLLVIAIGVYAWAALAFKERRLRDDLESK